MPNSEHRSRTAQRHFVVRRTLQRLRRAELAPAAAIDLIRRVVGEALAQPVVVEELLAIRLGKDPRR
jgi:hypothetical protein